MLDDHAAYDDALQVAASFDELAAIHAELELANHQYMALLPLRNLALQEQQLHLRLHQWRGLHAALPHWFATQGVRLWDARCTELQAQLTQHQQGIATARSNSHFDFLMGSEAGFRSRNFQTWSYASQMEPDCLGQTGGGPLC